MEKPKRRSSDSDADPKFISPPRISSQTAPANPFFLQSAPVPGGANPFQRANKNLRPTVRTTKTRQVLTSPRLSVPDKWKLKAEGFDPQDSILAHKIRQKEGCIVRIFREKGYAYLLFDSEQKANDCLARGLTIEGHPNLVLSKIQRVTKKSVMERLGQPTVQFSSAVPDPRMSVTTREDHPRMSVTTREEQLFLLEQRDNQLREQLRPGGDTLKGSCEDMCPEKERLWREDRRCLSSYEMLPGGEYKVDHTAAVKEFSRSAADKSQPLPHELRTESALERTVLYLCHKIMSFKLQSKDWYQFLSNRLEAVRQDITVQHLCSLRTAKLMECCVRFHELCAFLLLNSPFEQQDFEMNDNSLRSIITPLLQMYKDLRLEGVTCPNETLFVSYSLVLGIQTEKIAQDLLQIPDEVILSPPVQNVLRIWRAVATEDYVTFFKLLRGAEFLTACLLNRFVPRMRLQALRLINKQTSKQGDTIETETITRQLCFDDVTECIDICLQLELQCDTTSLYLNPAKQVQSAVKQLPLSLILQKNTQELGEVVYGAPLPPVSSSDTPKDNWDNLIDSLAQTETLHSIDYVLNSLVDDVAREVLKQQQRQQFIDQLSGEIGVNIIYEGVGIYLQEEVDRELTERCKIRDTKLFIENFSNTLLVSIQQDIMIDIVTTGLTAESNHRDLLYRVVSSMTDSTYSGIEDQLIRELVLSEAETGIQEAKERRKVRLEQQRVQVVNMRLRNAWKQWKDVIAIKERKRDVIKKFPKVAPDWIAQDLWRLGNDTNFVSQADRERKSSWLRQEREKAELERIRLLAPIDILLLLGKILVSRSVTDWLLVLLAADGSAVWPVDIMTSLTTDTYILADTQSNGIRIRVKLIKRDCAITEIKGCSAVLLLAGDVTVNRDRIDILSDMRTSPLVPLGVLHTREVPSLSYTPPCVGKVWESCISKGLCVRGRKELESTLVWLAEHSQATPLLHCKILREYVADRMYTLCFKPAATHSAERERKGIIGTRLSNIASLYSAAIRGVREELTGWRTRQVNWPVHGDNMWDWNEDNQLTKINTCLNELSIESDIEEVFIQKYMDISTECNNILSTHAHRLKRLGIPLSPPWADILESILNTRMESVRFSAIICYQNTSKYDIEIPYEWSATLSDVINRSVSIAPKLRQKLVQSDDENKSRKRSIQVIQPISEEPARKSARLNLEKSLLQLEGLITEEISQSEHINTLLQYEDDVRDTICWEDQLAWVENEINILKTRF
ncbi:Germinal-center associated nuclear protein isoform X3 [Oopsacas minuta]|uniref:Germinal-center associated nuclear protein isoform X3 n=1 Tax=Oopsacas minuta TaxID=111878 RepID=A0AAV7JJF7_9METZ|nr:Germinal-center associated nuclear protein isoform X3 [Oopsacas minuta]